MGYNGHALLTALGATSGNPGALGVDGSPAGLIWEMNALRAEDITQCCTVAPTVARVGAGKTRVNSAGLIEVVPANTLLRDYDPVTLAVRGFLIEESRTNLAWPSADFSHANWAGGGAFNNWTVATVTANAAAAPNGATEADLITCVNPPTSGRASRWSVTPGATYTATLYLKRVNGTGGALFNVHTGNSGTLVAAQFATVNITNYSTSVYTRATITFTVPASGVNQIEFGPSMNTVGDSFLAWGADLQLGAFATSHIPTTTASATRSADTVSVPLSAIAGFSQTEGTMVGEWVIPVSDNCYVAQLDDGTNSNRIWLATNGAQVDAHTFAGDVAQVVSSIAFTPNTAVHKVASAWKVNDFAVSLDGSVALADTSGTVPPVTTLRIGGNGVLSGYETNGHIRKLRLYNTRLTNAELQAMTA